MGGSGFPGSRMGKYSSGELFLTWLLASTRALTTLPLPAQDEGPSPGPAPQFVRASASPAPTEQVLQQAQYDVAVCGGTLGVFLATALAQRGFRVALVEGGPLRGRDQVKSPQRGMQLRPPMPITLWVGLARAFDRLITLAPWAQEWNISRKECMELVEVRCDLPRTCVALSLPQAHTAGLWAGLLFALRRCPPIPSLYFSFLLHLVCIVTHALPNVLALQLGILSEAELESVIVMEFNPVRVGFAGAGEVWTRDVLNCEWVSESGERWQERE